MDVPLESNSITPNSIGGNFHNVYLERNSLVSIYKAVEDPNHKLCHVGDYVTYKGEEVCLLYNVFYCSTIIV